MPIVELAIYNNCILFLVEQWAERGLFQLTDMKTTRMGKKRPVLPQIHTHSQPYTLPNEYEYNW